MASEPDHIDPAFNSTVDGGCLAVNSFEGLMRYNAEGKLEPACAVSSSPFDHLRPSRIVNVYVRPSSETS